MNPTTPTTFVEKDLKYYLRMLRDDFSELEGVQVATVSPEDPCRNVVLVFKQTFVGNGDDLGKTLLIKLIHSLVRAKAKPRALIFWYEAVRLCLQDSPVLEELMVINKLGVEILVCEASVSKLALASQLKVGYQCSMDHICEYLLNSWKVVCI